jgi:hypothetical protein
MRALAHRVLLQLSGVKAVDRGLLLFLIGVPRRSVADQRRCSDYLVDVHFLKRGKCPLMTQRGRRHIVAVK